jgi:hypothetical protein
MQPGPAQPDHRNANEGQWVFWLLFGLATVGFAPCILLPAWRDYQAAVLVEQIQAGEVARLESDLERQRQLADALRSEPSVIARAAQRELEYTRPGEIRVDVNPAPVAEHAPVAASGTVQPPAPPAPIRRVLAWLPPLNYDAVFCDPPTRMVIMVMSGGVLLAAFALFPPGREGAEPSTLEL